MLIGCVITVAIIDFFEHENFFLECLSGRGESRARIAKVPRHLPLQARVFVALLDLVVFSLGFSLCY